MSVLDVESRSPDRVRVVENTLSLFAAQLAAYVFPLATIPYLARILGPTSWGMVALAQSLGLYLSMLVDFGFQLSATRRLARVRNDQAKIAEIVAAVQGAKLFLACVSIIAVLLTQLINRHLEGHALILWAGALSGVAQSFNMLWFFQGIERMRPAVIADVVCKALICLCVFLFVRQPSHAARVLVLQCIFYAISSVCQLSVVRRMVPLSIPTRHHVLDALRDSAAMFLFRSSVSLYTTGNTFILGALATSTAVGYYSGAERLLRAILSLLTPLAQALFPSISRLVIHDAGKAIRLTRLSLAFMTGSGILAGMAAALTAPFAVKILFGPSYKEAIPVIRVLALLAPASAISTVLGIQWMLPLGLERAYNFIVMCAAVINAALALLWVSKWQQLGMAWAVVTTEYLVVVAICVLLGQRRLTPLSNQEKLIPELHKLVVPAGGA